MFSWKKIAAISGLLGGLAVTCVGAAQAHDGGSLSGCTRDAQGNIACIQKSETVYTSRDGRYVVQQAQDCSTTSREYVVRPESGVGQQGITKVGSVVGCSNTAPRP